MLWIFAGVGPGPHASGSDWLIWVIAVVVGSCIAVPLVIRHNRQQRHK